MADKAKTKAKVQKVQSGLGVTADGVYGPKTRAAVMENFRGPMLGAIKYAEGNPRNHGVLSVPVRNPEHASQIVTDSTTSNLDKFMTGRSAQDNYDNSNTPKFVDFMRERWAPVNADDPSIRVTPKENELNPNWAPNVRKYLKHNYPEQYPQWKQMNLVKTPMDQFQAVA